MRGLTVIKLCSCLNSEAIIYLNKNIVFYNQLSIVTTTKNLPYCGILSAYQGNIIGVFHDDFPYYLGKRVIICMLYMYSIAAYVVSESIREDVLHY